MPPLPSPGASSEATPIDSPASSSHSKQQHKTTSSSAPDAGNKTRHEDMQSFDQEGHLELKQRLSRTASRFTATSGATQDPTGEDFDYKTHLEQMLRKEGKEGVLSRSVGVTFEGVRVTGEGSGVAYASSLGEILTAVTRLGSTIKDLRHPSRKDILVDFTGSVRPKEMLLVLGRPGSGCSTLLKVLSNNTEAYASIEGDISYDGADPAKMKKHHSGDIVYLPEDDVHLPSLTVKQTLDFAAAARTPASGARIGTRAEAIANTRDVLVSLFGLRHTLNTKVGNDIVRGVSGGERKRVSIAELMTTGAKIACHDNSTRGLDASTALEYTRALRIATDVKDLTTILSIYQCGENIYTLFDKVCVIYDGRMAYFGPMSQAVSYFTEMGYEPQNRQTSADFLVAVTDPGGRFARDGFEARVPKTAEEFARYFKESQYGKHLVNQIAKEKKEFAPTKLEAFSTSAHAERAKNMNKGSSYLISYLMQLRLSIVRRFQMQMGELPTLIITTVAAIFQALIIGSVYFPLPNDTSGFFSRGGVIFFAILYNSFTGMAEITTSYAQRPIVVRHRQYAMIHPSADILALNLVDVPFKFVTIVVFDIILYFLAGLQASAAQFFVFLLFTFTANLAMLAIFRSLASSARKMAVATMMAGLLVLIIAIYVGYAIPRPSMVIWFRWLSYAQPVSFAFEALLSNEFRTLNVPCATLVPSGVGYESVSIINQVCSVVGAEPGSAIVVGSVYLMNQFGYTYANTWRNLGVVFAYLIFFLGVNLVTTEYQVDESASGGLMLFKRGSTPPPTLEQVANDEEKVSPQTTAVGAKMEDSSKVQRTPSNLAPPTDIFTWRDVNYDVMIKGQSRRLLNQVSGFVAPGKMTCLMGESGAGKTTLLNVLAQRVSMGIVTGDMLVNGKPLPISFQRQTGYCQQQDTHMATSTVREALVFSALLRQASDVPKADKLAYVEEIIGLLEMDEYAEAVVGEVGMGLNVEQRKRLTIGVELAAKPALLIFLDEPSSGLDSQSSWAIIQLLRKLADHGQAILATIHQPSSELFQVFDRLLLLKKGGETVYFGELGYNSSTLIDYFEARTELKCSSTDNPAEYILNAIGAGASAKADKDWHGMWRESDEFKGVQGTIDMYHRKAPDVSTADAAPDAEKGYAAPSMTQVSLVTQRAFQNYWRTPNYVLAKVMLNILAGLFIGFSFWNSSNSPSGLQVKLFAVFMSVVLCAPLSQQLQPQFIAFRTLYTARERPSRMYNWPVLVVSSIVVEIPYNIFAGTIFFVCYYYTVGFPSGADRAGYHYLMYMLFQLFWASFATWVAALAPNPASASILFSTFFSFVIIFNGVVQPYVNLPYFWRSWMYRLTPFTYLIEGLLANALGGVEITCSAQEFTNITVPSGETCASYLAPFFANGSPGYVQEINGACGYCAFRNGDQFLATVNMSFANRYRDVGFMCAYILFNFAAVFFFFWITTIVDWSSVHILPQKKEKKEKVEPEAIEA